MIFRALMLMVMCSMLAAVACSAGEAEKAKPTPWKGKAHEIPGTIEAEHFDEGPAEVAYHDNTPKNEGVKYREETQVDIEKRNDASNGHGVGWMREGEWLVYTVDVKEAGTYTVEFPVASNKKGGTFHLESDGADVSGPIEIPDSGGWTKLVTINKTGVKLKKGVQVIKLVCDKNGESKAIGDIDLMKFTRTGD